MTQLDLPQISLSRYVDLLKRRRWQVIPVSLLGLLIGGVVAFFIPRYFVASAGIAYQPPPGEKQVNREDPFGAIIDSAKLTIPRAIPDTIKALGWPEGLIEDPFELSQNVEEIEERLEIVEFGDSRNRSFALIKVSYKDRDGLRAAAFLNKLVGTWIEQRQGELMADAKRRLASANGEYKQHSDAYNTFLQERQHLQKTYRIEPGVDLQMQRDKHGELVDAHTEKLEALGGKRVAMAQLEAQLEHERKVLREMPARVLVDLAVLQAEAAKSEQGKAILEQIAYHALAKESFNPGHPKRDYHDRNIAYLTTRLTTLIETPDMAPDGTIPNPDRDTQREKIAKLELEQKKAGAEVKQLEQELAEEGDRLARQAEGYLLYERATQSLDEARRAVDAAVATVSNANQTVGKLTNEPSVRPEGRATVPPAPTEPNLLIVALLGCVIGLFAATALVLLLDVLQGSFKTVDDVEKSLAVPVLGGVSYIETEAQRRQAVRSRRRATLVAAAFLTLVGGVVLLYYFDPTRLPPIVRDMLAMVLGTA